MSEKTSFEKYGETLLSEDLAVVFKKVELKYVSSFTAYTEDGVEVKFKANSQMLKALKKMWKQDGKAKQ